MRTAEALLALLLCLVLMMPCARAEYDLETFLKEAPIVQQADSRYQTGRYTYQELRFNKRGCGPASVANALMAAAGISDQDAVDGLLYETMRLLTFNYTPRKDQIDLRHLDRLADCSAENYPTVAAVRESVAGNLLAYDKKLTAEKVQTWLKSCIDSGEPALLAARIGMDSQWKDVLRIAEWLCEAGRGEAVLSLGFLAVGTKSVRAPFAMKDGHYVAICMKASEFVEKGTLYLLDSNPRALPWEIVDREKYFSKYPLTSKSKKLWDYQLFTRLTPSLIRIDPLERESWTPPEADEEAVRLSRETLLNRLIFFGTSCLFVRIP